MKTGAASAPEPPEPPCRHACPDCMNGMAGKDACGWCRAAATAADLARVLELVGQLDADLARTAPAQYSIGLLRGRLKTILQAPQSNRSEP